MHYDFFVTLNIVLGLNRLDQSLGGRSTKFSHQPNLLLRANKLGWWREL